MVFSSYWSDKYFILRNHYKQPYQFEGELIIMVQNIASLSLVAHAIGSLISFSNSAIMVGEINIRQDGNGVDKTSFDQLLEMPHI